MNQLCGPFHSKVDYFVLICPTFAQKETCYRFAEKHLHFFVVICEQNQMENWLTIEKTCFEVTNTLFILNYCPTLKDARGRTSHLVSLGPGARHNGISLWVLI